MKHEEARKKQEGILTEQLASLGKARRCTEDKLEAMRKASGTVAHYLPLAQALEIICREERAALLALNALATSSRTENVVRD